MRCATPDDYADAGRVINEEAERMRRLVEDLLELSKIESGQVRLSLEPCDLASLVGQLVERVERRVAEQGVTLAQAIEDTPAVRADAVWVERAVDNLVDNALKHTPSGGTMTIATGLMTVPVGPRNGSAAGSVEAAILPTLPSTTPARSSRPADQSRVFERFYQLNKARSTSGAAAGWVWPSPRRSYRPTGDGSTSRARGAVGPSSPFCCRVLDRLSGRGVASLRPDRESVT